MKKIILSIAFLASIFLAKPTIAYYETEEVNQLVVDKSIKGLDQAEWKDNYSNSDFIFKPGDQFEFKITIKNTGNRNLTWLQINDKLPSSLDYIFGREGSVFENQGIGWSIPELKPGEQQDTVIRVKVNGSVPISLKEWVNFAEGKAESSAYDSDTSAFWTAEGTATVEKAQTLPDTGISDQILVGSLISGSMFAMAIFFRKYSRGY